MNVKLKTAVIAAGITGTLVIGGCTAAGFIKRSDGKASKAHNAVHTTAVSEEVCHEN